MTPDGDIALPPPASLPLFKRRIPTCLALALFSEAVLICVVRAGCVAGCGARGMRWGCSPVGCRGDQGIAVVMTPYANPIKEVSIQFARLVARSVVLEGARLRMRSFPGVISVKQDFCQKSLLFSAVL